MPLFYDTAWLDDLFFNREKEKYLVFPERKKKKNSFYIITFLDKNFVEKDDLES